MNLGHIMMDLVQRNPQIVSNPRAKAMLDVIESGDSVKGEQLANNLCRTYGVTKDEAIQQAANYFHINP